jgi:hypothetical protein
MVPLYNKTMQTERRSLLLAVIFVLFFALYVFKGITTLDPDFGWHIRAGQYILTYGFPYKDPFSYTMSSFLFVDHEWLTNLIWAVMLPVVGYTQFALLYALLAVAAIFLQITRMKKNWIVLPLILIGGSILDFSGVRTQVIDWLFISLLVTLLLEKTLWEKWRFFLPLLFLLWANSHGGFGIGLGVLLIVLSIKSWEEKRELKKNIFLFILCVLITLLNPFGIRLWGEFFNQLSDSQLRWTINEWNPAIYFTNLAFWFYTGLSVFLFIRYFRRFSLATIAVYSLFFLAAIASIRNIPIFVIVSFYPTVKGIEYLYEEASKYKFGKERFVKGYYVFIAVSLLFFLPQLGMFLYSVSLVPDRQASYPVGAVSYLKNHFPKGNIMTTYGWGGYLLWKLPEKKDFVDGRMPSWKNASAPKNESSNAFAEYQAILKQQEPFSTAVTEYDVHAILVPASELEEKPNRVFGMNVESNPMLKFLFGSVITFAKVVSQARHMGWHEVYHDDTAVVFEK